MANKYLSKINFEGTEYLIKDTENRTELSNFQDEVDSAFFEIQDNLALLQLTNNIIISALLIKAGQNMGYFYYSEDFDFPSNDDSNSITLLTGNQLMALVISKTSPYLLLWDVEEMDLDTGEVISINGATIAPIISHLPADFNDNSQGKVYCRLNDDEIVEIILDLSDNTNTMFTWQKYSVTEKINLAKTETVEELTTILNNTINEEISPLATKLDYTNIAYGTCATAADVATKEITLNSNVANHWKQEIGSMIVINFNVSNSASNVKIKVGNNDAYPIWYNNAEYTSTGTAYTGYANRPIVYMFNGTHWVWITGSYDSNTTYTNEKLGNGYGTCSTAASTTAKTATFSSYTLVKHGMVSIKFTNAVPASATLNINGKGAKNIYYRGAKIVANIIKAGDIATFVYDGTQYQLIAIDRWQNDIDTLTTNLSQLSNKVDTNIAPLDSPPFIGNPTAPTPPKGDNDTSIATTAFVQTAIDEVLNASPVMTFKGVLTETVPGKNDYEMLVRPWPADIGDTYAIGVNCTVDTNETIILEIGDLIICKESYASNITESQFNNYWTVVQTSIDGLQDKLTAIDNALDATVNGPSGSTVNHIATFADGTGKTIKDSGFTIASNVPANAKFTDTIYTLPIANENALGGVKEGGDIAIDSNGIMTVKDDSHNHVISNIDGLQDKLTAIDNTLDTVVSGPSSSTANHVAIFTDNTGKAIKNSGFTIASSVPANAKFTDTVYSLPIATTDVLGGVKAGGDININSSTGIMTVKDDSHNHIIDNVDGLQNKLNEKAPLDSPAFTGSPTAPTPAVTDNDTSIATTAFVQAAISNTLKIAQALVFKGTILFTHATPPDGSGFEDAYFPQLSLPTDCSPGEVYVAGRVGFCGHQKCEIGDLIICQQEGSDLDYDYPIAVNPYWTVVQTNINGAVTGPATSANDNIAIFNGTTGTLIKDSGISKTTLSNALNVIDEHEERLDDLDPLKRSDYVYTTANQALTNKTYNGYTLKDAAGRGVDSAPTINSNNLVESGALYTKFTAIDNHFDEVETKTISTTANDDDVVVLSSSGGVYSVSYTASHASQGPANGYTSGNTTTSITSSGTIKIPQITVNKYGHVTAAADESVTITMPTVPTGFTITPTLTDDNVIDLTGSAKTNGFSLDAKHAKKGPSSGYTSGNSTTSISDYGDSKTIKIPQITVDAYGHVTAAADESVTITMPSAQTLPRTFSIKNTSVAANSWVSSTRNSMYPYQATVNISNVTENYIVTPKYNNMDLIKYIISPETLSNSGNITIYAKNKPTTAITIPEINCYQTN